MAQARRTGQQRKTRKKKQGSKAPSSNQWGLLFIVLVSGVAIGALLFGYGPFGKGLKNYRQQSNQQQLPVVEDSVANNEVVNKVERTEKEFTYPNVLENDIGRVLPDDFSAADHEREKKKSRYIMQLASFKSIEGAQELRAKLALKGIETRVEEKAGNFRVKMGPYDGRRKLKNSINKVKAAGLGLNPIGIKYTID